MDLVPDVIVVVENSALVQLLHRNLYEQRKPQLSCCNSIYNQEMDNKLR